MSLLDPMKTRLTQDLEPILQPARSRARSSAPTTTCPTRSSATTRRRSSSSASEVGMLETRLDAEGQARRPASRSPSAWTRRCGRSSRSRTGSRRSASRAPRPSSRRSTPCSPSTRHSSISSPSGCPDDPDPLRRHRLHHAHRRPLPRLPDLLAARAAEGPGRRRRPCSSTPASSTAPPAFASWACSTPSTTTARRSSEQESSSMASTQTIKTLFASDIDRRIEEVIKVDQTDEEILRDEIDEYVVDRRDPLALRLASSRRTARHAEQAARGHRRLGLGLLRLRQVELRQDARPRDREPRSSPASPPSKRFAERAGDNKLTGPARPDQPRRSRPTPSSSTSPPTAASGAATRR